MTAAPGSARTAFVEAFGRPPGCVWWAPGRVNLIGEHTDYNDGYVLPLAIPFGVQAAVRERPDRVLRVVSAQSGPAADLRVDTLRPGGAAGWSAYVAGVVWALGEAGHEIGGLDVLVDGDVPLGAGLSSSAALECSVAAAVVDLFDLGLDRSALVQLTKRSENAFVGVPNGILDQSASLLATEGHLLFLDTRTLASRQVPFDLARHGLALLVVDTRAPHALVDGEYAARRLACEAAARELGVPALRDVDLAELPEALARLVDPVIRRRARHVVTEDDRVLRVVGLLDAGDDPRAIGSLLTASHVSLRDDFEVTVPALDVAVDAALDAGAHGARMTGAGFGGCVITLVDTANAPAVERAVAEAFRSRGFAPPKAFEVTPAAGAHRLEQPVSRQPSPP